MYILIVQQNIGYLGYQHLPYLKESYKADYGHKAKHKMCGTILKKFIVHPPPKKWTNSVVHQKNIY